MTVPLLENADLIQYETDIEEDEIALEDPRVYTLSLQATSSILPLVSGGLVRATQYFPTLQLTVIDDAGEFGHVGVAWGRGGGKRNVWHRMRCCFWGQGASGGLGAVLCSNWLLRDKPIVDC